MNWKASLMKSTRNIRTTPTTPIKTPLSQRRLKTKPALMVLAILLAGNLFWFIMWLLPSKDKSNNDEVVATIDGDNITRQQWLAKMESMYGKETLQGLVNEAVMDKAAKQHKISVSDEEIDLELALMRSAQDTTDQTFQSLSDKELRQKIRTQLILEKVLAKDIIITDEAVENFYKDNQSLYNIPTSYRTSMIVADSKENIDSVLQELENGSEFPVLARERSIDTPSASLGGDIGFITEQQANIDSAILKAVAKLEKGATSDAIVLGDGRYAVLHVSEIKEGQSFTYEEVAEHIKRVLAVEQLSASITPEIFWADYKVDWFYGEAK